MALSTPAKVIRTAKWATIMTKWRIGFETGGKSLGSPRVKPIQRWQLVGFPGPAGRESAGIVDLMAIRKDRGWQPDYENPGIMDGTGWSVDIEFGDRKIHSGESNNYPGGEEDDPDLEEGSVFRRFLKAVQNLIGGLPFK